jgi:hypothetical protein
LLSQHPANLILRFVLEITALVSVGQWGWSAGRAGAARIALAFGLPLMMAAAWAVFRPLRDSSVPGGKKPIVAIPGRARLALELVFWAAAVAAMFAAGSAALAFAMILALLLHHLWSADRLVALWRGS